MNESAIRRALQEVGLRATYPRIALLTELSRSHKHPKSAAELTATLSQFPRSTIYRSLDALEKSGIIKSSLIKWVRRYELGDSLAPHHHHLTCIRCQAIVDFDSSRLERRLDLIAREHSYQLLSHVVELRGVCSNCHTPSTDRSIARDVVSFGLESMKRLRRTDPLMQKLRDEDVHEPFRDRDSD